MELLINNSIIFYMYLPITALANDVVPNVCFPFFPRKENCSAKISPNIGAMQRLINS